MEKEAQGWYEMHRGPSMGEGAKKLLHEAMGLPHEERAELAAELIASLDGPADADVETAWALEIERRAAKVLSGESQGLPWEEVRDRIKREISGR
jgi:putative addiction module component (TIGR02574 family)